MCALKSPSSVKLDCMMVDELICFVRVLRISMLFSGWAGLVYTRPKVLVCFVVEMDNHMMSLW